MTAEDLLGALGKRIRRLREERGWSQEDLARACHRHFTYIGRIERGDQNVTLEVLHDVAAGLEVSVADLLAEEHPLLAHWKVTAMDVIQAISHGFRTQVDVRGKLAEWMLFKELCRLKDRGMITGIEWLDEDGKPDFIVDAGNRKVIVECKNVRSLGKQEMDSAPIRVELQRTRDAKDGSNTRGYKVDHFDVLSACLFNRTGNWEFYYIAANKLATRPNASTYLKVMQEVPNSLIPPWRGSFLEAVADRWPSDGVGP